MNKKSKQNQIFIIGISAFYHDSASCILCNGDIIAAAQEERFTRKKHDKSFPSESIKYCLKEAKITPKQISEIIFYEQPKLKLDRLFKTYMAFAPKGAFTFFKVVSDWFGGKINQKKMIANALNTALEEKINWKKKIRFSTHHLSHAASAYYPSPFKNAAILTMDGVGEWTTTSVAIGKGSNLHVVKEIHFPHSIGLLYSAFTYYLGFKVNSGEYKVMGLAPYGNPIYSNLIKEKLVKIFDDGSFQLDMSYFDFATGMTMTNNKFDELFGGCPRRPEDKITEKEMDLAASIQKVTEDIVLKIAKNIAKETGQRNLCLAGGVALNCVANGKLLQEKLFEKIWIQPASGDAGGALGAALYSWYCNHKKRRISSFNTDMMKGSFLGPSFTDNQIKLELDACGAQFTKHNQDDMLEKVVNELVSGKAVGWMQGPMEFGPRALGGRSIIADPRSPKTQSILNLKVKYRESFRPFAPSILSEYVNEWFEHDTNSPYMLFVANIKKSKRRSITDEEKQLFGIDKLNVNRSLVPAVTHIDYSARIQTVHKKTNPLFYKLITKFKERTGCPILVNTSFNVRGEPIVCTPTDSFKCFMGTELDVLAIGNYFLLKTSQKSALKENYKENYEKD